MAKQARKAMQVSSITAIHDRSCFKSRREILACHQGGIVPLVPKSI